MEDQLAHKAITADPLDLPASLEAVSVADLPAPPAELFDFDPEIENSGGQVTKEVEVDDSRSKAIEQAAKQAIEQATKDLPAEVVEEVVEGRSKSGAIVDAPEDLSPPTGESSPEALETLPEGRSRSGAIVDVPVDLSSLGGGASSELEPVGRSRSGAIVSAPVGLSSPATGSTTEELEPVGRSRREAVSGFRRKHHKMEKRHGSAHFSRSERNKNKNH
jgi:hypothetical protein